MARTIPQFDLTAALAKSSPATIVIPPTIADNAAALLRRVRARVWRWMREG